ncbi:hypothetical protein J6590_070950 [Homalodisca vitripennis]|nr:hypothetical protein J6590_070950 [Homalodisca vitripennis]
MAKPVYAAVGHKLFHRRQTLNLLKTSEEPTRETIYIAAVEIFPKPGTTSTTTPAIVASAREGRIKTRVEK